MAPAGLRRCPTEIPEEAAVRADQEGAWRSISPPGEAEGELDKSRAHDGGSCDDIDSAEICALAGDRIYQREECDPHCQDLSGPKNELCRSALLVQGVFCVDGASGRAGDTGVYPAPGGGRPQVDPRDTCSQESGATISKASPLARIKG